MRWMWIDRIVSMTPGKELVAVKHVSLAEDYLRDHFAEDPKTGREATPVMPASLIIEGMAQTAGVLVGHTGGFREKVILAKITRAELSRDAGPGATLRYTATLDRIDTTGAATSGLVELRDDPSSDTFNTIGQVDLIFSHLDRNLAGDEFPEHNFVFGESFQTLMRMSGVSAE